ncbi:MAG: site-2 protease family protein, partial [Methanobacteriota archaeon]
MMGMDAEVENLRAAVSRHFTVSQITVNPFAVTFRVTSDPTAFDGAFDALRKDLVPKNFIPSIVQEPSGYVIHVQRRPETKFRGNQVNVLLLLVTVGTAWVAGAVNWQVYANLPGPNMEAFGYGLVSFTVPLLAILGAHEMGHYVMAKRHGVRASLPFFIPSVPPLGTFGAFISMRDPIPNR